ncbi:MAG: MFS transporter, partial [Planctomycetaceae bacterium]|nr:MFS transporter [Planctomycetaceae bacterium]
MDIKNKATRINLLDFHTRPMRTFHMTWFAFFLCFFAWFGIAPLMAVVREDLSLTKEQIGNTIIASVAITIFARLFVGWLCDGLGPRLSYSILLIFGSIPVMAIGLSSSYETFLLFRLGIGVIGASFV